MKQIFTFTASALLLASCQQIDLGDKISSVVAQDDTYSVLVTSKSGDSNVDIPSPLTIYAVNADGLVEKRASVTEEGATSVNLSLVSGDYTFYAIAGADAGNDDVPENNMVTAENGYFTKPVMRCTKNATVDDETELPLTLSYAVAAVDFTLNNISSDVKAVSVKLGALRESMSLAGEYAGTTTATLDLTKQSDGTTWKSAVAYVFPSVSAPTTLTITQTMTDDTKQSYTASYNAKLLAGTPYHFSGTGANVTNHELTVTVTSEGWGDAIDEELVLTPIGSGDGTGAIDTDGETFLVSAMPTESGIVFEGHVLAYLDGDKGLLYAKQDCTQDQIAEYSEGDITDWSVPTLEQYNNIKTQAKLPKLSSAIKSLTNNALPYDGHYYYCGDCSIAFSWVSNVNNGQVAVGNTDKTYHLRLVKEVTFKLKD